MAPRRAVLGLGLLAVAYLAWGGLYIHRTSFVVDGERLFVLWDDAMVSMRYAANLANGEGLRWNAGEEPVQGFSNPAITLAMALLHLLPVGATRISLVVQLANLAGLAVLPSLTWNLARRMFPEDARAAALGALACAASAPLAIWGLQGSDTTAVCLWLMAALAIRERTGGRSPGLLFPFLALGLLIRLDTALFGAVFAAEAGLRSRGALRPLLWAGLSYATVLAGFCSISLRYYGDLLPNSFFLKVTGMPLGTMIEWGAIRLGFFWTSAVPALLLAAVATARFRGRPAVLLAAGLVVAAAAYEIGVGSDWAAEHGSRFVTPVLPPLLVLTCAGGRWLLRRGSAPRSWQRRAAGLPGSALLLVVCVLASPRLPRTEWFDPRAPTMYREDNVRNARLGLYLRDHTSPSTTIAVHWAGLTPYLSGRRAIDVLGKSDRHIAKRKVARFAPGHAKWDWRYVLDERKPDIILDVSRGLDRLNYFLIHYRRVRSGELVFSAREGSLHRIDDPAAIVEPPGDRGPLRAAPSGGE